MALPHATAAVAGTKPPGRSRCGCTGNATARDPEPFTFFQPTDPMTELLHDFNDIRPVVEMYVGRLLLLSLGLFVVWRIGKALYHFAGLMCFGLLCWKHTKADARPLSALAVSPVIFFDLLIRGEPPQKVFRRWGRRSDGEKVQAFTWRGGFDWDVKDPDDCQTRRERMTRDRPSQPDLKP